MTFSLDGMRAIVCDDQCVRMITMTSDGGVERADLFAGSLTEDGHRVGNGRDARFGWLRGSATDSKGNYYVSDSSNHCIYRITPTADVTVYCGTSRGYGYVNGEAEMAQFSGPLGLCFDGDDNLLVADSNNHAIRLVRREDRSVITLAGKESSGKEA